MQFGDFLVKKEVINQDQLAQAFVKQVKTLPDVAQIHRPDHRQVVTAFWSTVDLAVSMYAADQCRHMPESTVSEIPMDGVSDTRRNANRSVAAVCEQPPQLAAWQSKCPIAIGLGYSAGSPLMPRW